jgi:hypothetical protein
MSNKDAEAMARATEIAAKHRKGIQADTHDIKEGLAVALILLWSFCMDMEHKGAGKAKDILGAAIALFLRDEASSLKIARGH